MAWRLVGTRSHAFRTPFLGTLIVIRETREPEIERDKRRIYLI